MREEADPKKEDLKAGDNEGTQPAAPKQKEAMEKAEAFQKDAPGGGTHEDEVGRPAWGEEEGDLTGQKGKQTQHGEAPA